MSLSDTKASLGKPEATRPTLGDSTSGPRITEEIFNKRVAFPEYFGRKRVIIEDDTSKSTLFLSYTQKNRESLTVSL
jgi:hypothetical protein